MALTQVIGTGIGASNTVTSEGGAVTTSLQQGLAKAWASIDGSGPTVFVTVSTALVCRITAVVTRR